MGRRSVQQLSPAQWREALDEQIRAKEVQQQRRDGSPEAPQNRSQSAPQKEENHVSGLERPVTTSNCTNGTDNNPVVGGRRRIQHQQSQEEYLQGLQDQIEEKKRLAQELLKKVKTRRHHEFKNDEGEAVCWTDEERSAVSEAEPLSIKSLELQNSMAGEKITTSSNQHDPASHCQVSVKSEVAAQPEAITKIADFCEELKKQNEDVKRQLMEQRAVLVSLQSTRTVETDGKAPTVDSRRRDSVLRQSVEDNVMLKAENKRETSSIKKPEAKGSQVKSPAQFQVAPRPRPRGETKIPLPGKRHLSSLRSVGANIVKVLSPQSPQVQRSHDRKTEAKLDHSSRAASFEPLEPEHKNSFKLSQANAVGSEVEASTCQDPQQEVPESEAKGEDSLTILEKELDTKNSGDLKESSVCMKVQDDVENECPMDTESKLVHNWETDGGLLNCTSISILDGPSSLIPLDRSISQLF